MAKPTNSYPETATNAERKQSQNGDGEAAIQDALASHGEELAALVEGTDELDDALTTAILIAASADEEELAYLTSSASNLVEALDGLSTDGAAELATELGKDASDLSDALETVLSLQRAGHLDDIVEIASGFAESLSPQEVEQLSTMLEEDGSEIVEALDMILDLQRDGELAELVELAKTLSALDIDQDTAAGLNNLLGAVGEAQRESEPVGLFGLLRQLGSPDARAGLGYIVAILKAQGRKLKR